MQRDANRVPSVEIVNVPPTKDDDEQLFDNLDDDVSTRSTAGKSDGKRRMIIIIT